MLKIEIHESTPHNMLRAIRAACNELLGDTADLTGAGISVPSEERASARLAEQSFLASAFDKAVETVGAPAVAQALISTDKPLPDYKEVQPDGSVHDLNPADVLGLETDSTGAEWNPELHASTKAKNQDGTWKKRRGAGQIAVGDGSGEPLPPVSSAEREAPALPPLPPTPPAPAAPLVTMNDIYALITNGKAVLNDVIAAAQAMGFADVGAFSRDATPEQRAQLLAQLTKEA